MQITLKLYASLTDKLPATADRHAVRVDIPKDATVNSIVDQFNVPRPMAHLVLVNGVYLPADERDQHGRLQEGDTIAVWPPVAGG